MLELDEKWVDGQEEMRLMLPLNKFENGSMYEGEWLENFMDG